MSQRPAQTKAATPHFSCDGRLGPATNPPQTSRTGPSDPAAREEAASFIFCKEDLAQAFLFAAACTAPRNTASARKRCATVAKPSQDSNDEATASSTTTRSSANAETVVSYLLPGIENLTFNVVALILPTAYAMHLGLLLPAGSTAGIGVVAVAPACLPIMAPFALPMVSADSWMANKRARAFHRSAAFGVYAQGVLALFKFAQGDLVGGTYLGLQAAMGAYSITPDGLGMMPSYMVMAGFNGILGIIQVFQTFQGMPPHFIPMSAYMPPVLSILSCYWGWQFCREIRAIGAGLTGDGPQDSCWVSLMGSDVWPLTALSTSAGVPQVGDAAPGAFATTGSQAVRNRFSAFGGSGHVLGEA